MRCMSVRRCCSQWLRNSVKACWRWPEAAWHSIRMAWMVGPAADVLGPGIASDINAAALIHVKQYAVVYSKFAWAMIRTVPGCPCWLFSLPTAAGVTVWWLLVLPISLVVLQDCILKADLHMANTVFRSCQCTCIWSSAKGNLVVSKACTPVQCTVTIHQHELKCCNRCSHLLPLLINLGFIMGSFPQMVVSEVQRSSFAWDQTLEVKIMEAFCIIAPCVCCVWRISVVLEVCSHVLTLAW